MIFFSLALFATLAATQEIPGVWTSRPITVGSRPVNPICPVPPGQRFVIESSAGDVTQLLFDKQYGREMDFFAPHHCQCLEGPEPHTELRVCLGDPICKWNGVQYGETHFVVTEGGGSPDRFFLQTAPVEFTFNETSQPIFYTMSPSGGGNMRVDGPAVFSALVGGPFPDGKRMPVDSYDYRGEVVTTRGWLVLGQPNGNLAFGVWHKFQAGCRAYMLASDADVQTLPQRLERLGFGKPSCLDITPAQCMVRGRASFWCFVCFGTVFLFVCFFLLCFGFFVTIQPNGTTPPPNPTTGSERLPPRQRALRAAVLLQRRYFPAREGDAAHHRRHRDHDEHGPGRHRRAQPAAGDARGAAVRPRRRVCGHGVGGRVPGQSGAPAAGGARPAGGGRRAQAARGLAVLVERWIRDASR
jgi:hypothetical protein